MVSSREHSPLTCAECRPLIAGYAEGRLTPSDRARAAAHIDGCDRCYAAYRRQRDLARVLQNDLPGFGGSDGTRLQAVWGAVQAELQQPRTTRVRKREGVFAIALALVIILPWSAGGRAISQALPFPPTPSMTWTVGGQTPNRVQIAAATSPADVTRASTATPVIGFNVPPEVTEAATHAP